MTVDTIAAMPGLKRLNITGSRKLMEKFQGATLPASLQLVTNDLAKHNLLGFSRSRYGCHISHICVL